MTLNELKAQVALGTLDVLNILDNEDISELPLEVIDTLAQLYFIMLKACPYIYNWIETETRAHIYNKLRKIEKLNSQTLNGIRQLSPPFFDFRDSL